MRVLIDTNVLFSALLFPASVPSQALRRAITEHKDFLSLDIERPKCMNPAEFLEL